MQLSDRGESIIKNFEGLRLNAYKDSAGVWTIGYGSTRYHDGKAVKPDDKLANETQADALFRNTLNQYVKAVISKLKVPVTQNQFDALVSFTYNTGTASGKTLFAKLNAEDYQGAADQFLVWNKITDPHTGNKVENPTLTKRRFAERTLFLKT
jgi:lysozyme